MPFGYLEFSCIRLGENHAHTRVRAARPAHQHRSRSQSMGVGGFWVQIFLDRVIGCGSRG